MRLQEYITENLAGFKPGNPYRFQPGNKLYDHQMEIPNEVLARIHKCPARARTLASEFDMPVANMRYVLYRLVKKGKLQRTAYKKGVEAVWSLTGR